MKDFAKSIVCNTKVGNGLKEDMKRAHPNDSMVDDVKASATYEAIVKQPWRVYDILGVGDSEIREYAFDLIARKYGVDYDTIYLAWRDNGYKLSSWRGKEDKAQKQFQKLGVSVSNTKTGNSKVGNADILSGNYIILADNGEVWFRDEHENVHIRNIDSWAQKRIASYQSSIDEIKKGVAEAKQAAKKAGMI